MKKKSLAVVMSLLGLVGASGCNTSSAEVSKADMAIASAKPIASRLGTTNIPRDVKPQDPDFVPEKIAQAVLKQLRSWSNGKEFGDALLNCSAVRASKVQGDKSSCFESESGDPTACLVKRGYGRKSVGQALAADKVDLNGDGTPDYILTDRYYCMELSANQAQVHFVLLSQPSGDFRLVYADWTSNYLEVVLEPTTGAKVLVEKAHKTYGTYTRIMHMIDGKYVPRACVVEDDRGFHNCQDSRP